MSFIFQMDNTEQQPIASTSSSSRQSPVLVDYAPKQVALPTTTAVQQQRQVPSGINKWLASHGSSYLPHDQPPQPQRSSSPRRARRFSFHSESESSESESESDSDAELEDDDAIFLQPRRHLSRQSSAQASQTRVVPAVLLPTSTKNPLYLTAQRPALPVVDLSAASGHVELQDKSHWSDDDESELFSEDEDEEDSDELENEDGLWALHPDELEVPALVDDDESGPASTSTRSIPIPRAAASNTAATPLAGLMSRRLVSPAPRRKTSDDGQSFWTPWMDRYLADAARA